MLSSGLLIIKYHITQFPVSATSVVNKGKLFYHGRRKLTNRLDSPHAFSESALP